MTKNVSFNPWSRHKFINLYASKDDRWCNSIAFHDFSVADVKWKEWFDLCLSIFIKHKLPPMKLAVKGSLYGKPGKYMTFKGGVRKLEKNNFNQLESLGFVVMPDKEDYPSNIIIKAALYPSKNNIESKIVLSIDEKLEPYNKEFFEQLATEFYNFTKAKYGYFYRRHLTAEPDAYVSGGNIGFISEEEYRLCRIWKTEREVYDKGVCIGGLYATGKLRDIYKLNFLSLEHLNWRINNNNTLGDWIAQNSDHGQLKELSSSFWSWHVDDHLISSVRQLLIPTEIIICV